METGNFFFYVDKEENMGIRNKGKMYIVNGV